MKNIINSCVVNNDVSKNIQYTDDVCEEILYFANDTVTQYQQFNGKLNMKLLELQQNQTKNLEEILKKNDPGKICQDLKPQQTSAIDSVLRNIEEKVTKLEEQLRQFETLEEKLTKQQKKYEQLNDDQLKVLQKIKEKLTQNENKFAKYEKELPDMNNFSNKITNLSSWSHRRHRPFSRH